MDVFDVNRICLCKFPLFHGGGSKTRQCDVLLTSTHLTFLFKTLKNEVITVTTSPKLLASSKKMLVPLALVLIAISSPQ